MVWLIKKPDLVHHVLRVITDFILKKAELWVSEFGPENVMAFDLCIETNRLYSPKQFETFAYPYLKEVHDRVTELGVAIFLSHICGEQNRNLPFWAQLSYGRRGMVSVGREVALATASATFPDNVIMGNVDPVTDPGRHARTGSGALPGLHRRRQGPPRGLRPHVRLRGASAGASGQCVPDGQGLPGVRPVLDGAREETRRWRTSRRSLGV